MKCKSILHICCLLMVWLIGFNFELSFAGEKEETIATAMAEYLIAGRAVIAKNQPLINDPSKGDKGFTPGVYESQVHVEFMSATGIDLKQIGPTDDFNKAVFDAHESAKEVIAEAQPQINMPGKGFKGFNPAVFGARLGDKFFKKSGIVIKQTSLRYRGDYNKPDEFETKVINKFEKDTVKVKTYFEETTANGKRVARYMVPLYISKACLPCHGEPAGEKDVSGRIKEGYKEGDLRGAISIVVPVK